MNKKTLALGAVLIVLIASAYIYQVPLKRWQNNLGKPKNIFANVASEAIDKIEITSAEAAVVLTKQGQRWKIGGSKDFYADPAAIASLLAGVKTAASAQLEIVSNNPERKSEFRTDDSGLKIKFYQAGKLAADFISGKSSGSGSSYISAPKSAATYLVKAPLSDALNRAEWRDQNIFSSDKSKINKIRFQYPNREFSVELNQGKWRGILPKKFTVSQEQTGKIAEVMANLKAESIPEQSFKGTDLEKHLIIVEASGDGVDNILMIGRAKGDQYYAKTGDSDNIYLIGKAVRDQLDKARLLYQ